nr:ccr4 associated factor [Polyrhizophydium stewartii]
MPPAVHLPLGDADVFARLDGRAVVRIDGPDSVPFLQGMVTNQMTLVERGGAGILAAFLNAQGRILFDAFIFPENKGSEFPHPSFLIDCDVMVAELLETHLKRYKLRRKIAISNASDSLAVWQAWGRSSDLLWGSYVSRDCARHVPIGGIVPKESFCDVGCRDPRNKQLGVRFVLDRAAVPKLPTTFERVGADEFTLRRMMLGIPEGAADFFYEHSLPLESNLEFMSGVDFRKGCYLGQELTIRTYHTGVTRKRIVPIQIFKADQALPTQLTLDRGVSFELPESQSDLKPVGAAEKSTRGRGTGAVGKFCSGMNNIGLALVRLEHVHSSSGSQQILGEDAPGAPPGDLVLSNGLHARAFAPAWWPQAPPA